VNAFKKGYTSFRRLQADIVYGGSAFSQPVPVLFVVGNDPFIVLMHQRGRNEKVG
jgi:hypothetical protein